MRVGLSLLVALTLTAPPVLASDGAREINQACATGTGCFPGDEPGFPVTIGSSGRYILTGNLGRSSRGNVDEDMIEVQADNVDLDLGGFTISCTPVTLPGPILGDGPISFSGSLTVAVSSSCVGQAKGVDALDARNTTVRNGSITGFPHNGVSVRSGRIVGLHVSNSYTGISLSEGTVQDSFSVDNRESGINAGAAIVKNNHALRNGAQGIYLARDARAEGNVVRGNGSDGIFGGSIGAMIVDNIATGNGHYGIRVGYKDSYSGNSVRANTTGHISGGNNLGGNYCAAENGSNACP